MKTCICCGLTKPYSDYYLHSKTSDGYLGKCKECQKENSRNARAENIEYYRKYDRDRGNDPHRVAAGFHRDSAEDGVSYSALKAEALARENG